MKKTEHLLSLMQDWSTVEAENAFISFLVNSLEEFRIKTSSVLQIAITVDDNWFLDNFRKIIYQAIKEICLTESDDLYVMPGAVAIKAQMLAMKAGLNLNDNWAQDVIDEAKASFLCHFHSYEIIKDGVIPLWKLKLSRESIRKSTEDIISALDEKPHPDLFTEKLPKLIEKHQAVWSVALGEEEQKEETWDDTINELLSPVPEDFSISTGIQVLDNTIQGGISGPGSPFGGRLIVVGARPGMGKTTFAVTLATHLADTGYDIAFFSIEMPIKQIHYKTVACRDFLNLRAKGPITNPIRINNLRYRTYTPDQRRRLSDMANASFAPRFKIFGNDQNISSLSSRVKALVKARPNLRAVIIDYLQLMDGCDSNAHRTKTEAVGIVSSSLKKLAKNTGIDIILLSQLSRSVETRNDKMPTLSDLRESGNIEQDADIVIFLLRPGYYNQEHDQGELAVSVAKNRLGETGILQCRIDLASSVVFDYKR
jgi:replicative DNA helicase